METHLQVVPSIAMLADRRGISFSSAKGIAKNWRGTERTEFTGFSCYKPDGFCMHHLHS